MQYSTNTNTGFSIVEALVAIAVLLLAIVGPITIAMKGLQTAFYSREQATALYLAQEALEIVQAVRNDAAIAAIADDDLDVAWDWVKPGSSNPLPNCYTAKGCNLYLKDGVPTEVTHCANSDDCYMYVGTGKSLYVTDGGEAGDQTKFRRVLKLDRIGDYVEATVTVSWDSTLFNGSNQTVQLQSALYNIYQDRS